jgi:hypothetical protein
MRTLVRELPCPWAVVSCPTCGRVKNSHPHSDPRKRHPGWKYYAASDCIVERNQHIVLTRYKSSRAIYSIFTGRDFQSLACVLNLPARTRPDCLDRATPDNGLNLDRRREGSKTKFSRDMRRVKTLEARAEAADTSTMHGSMYLLQVYGDCGRWRGPL